VRHEHVDGRRTWFERVDAWPEGLVIVGDAVCALDPYFGLGMTACARGVAALGERAWDAPGAARAFQRALGGIVDVTWRLATADVPADAAAALHRRRLLLAAPRSPEVARLLLRRMHLLDAPDAIDGPEVAALLDAVQIEVERAR
jgi:2-polyprenyl-6-methoxyphenol hydroxylase-like FAD-dependent oxidoreductase